MVTKLRSSQALPVSRSSIMQVEKKRAWWNPKTWWDAGNVSYTTTADGKTHQYTLNQTGGAFKSCWKGLYSEQNMMTVFTTIPEVFAPIDLIAQTVSNGDFTLRRRSTDEVIEDNEKWNALKAKPNWRQDWRRFIYTAVVFKYVTGNRYLYKHLPKTLKPKFDNIAALWWLPSQFVWPILKTTRPKYFTTTAASDLVDNYELRWFDDSSNFAPYLINHDAFLDVGTMSGTAYLKGISPLSTCEYPMSNLCQVYEARNIIYAKRGAQGYIVSAKKDDSGSIALTDGEKKLMRETMNNDFGLTGNRDTIGILDATVDYLNIAMSIKDLEPFVETRADAAAIYGAVNVDFDLAPGPEGNTFENKKGAMSRLYQDVSIPEGNQLAAILTDHMQLADEDLYVHVSYEHIEVLQTDNSKEATARLTRDQALEKEYAAGLITKNDWRAENGVELKEGDNLYSTDVVKDGDPLATKIGVGGVTSLIAVLTAQGVSAEAKQASLEIIFGISPEDAARMVIEPEPPEPPPGEATDPTTGEPIKPINTFPK